MTSKKKIPPKKQIVAKNKSNNKNKTPAIISALKSVIDAKQEVRTKTPEFYDDARRVLNELEKGNIKFDDPKFIKTITQCHELNNSKTYEKGKSPK